MDRSEVIEALLLEAVLGQSLVLLYRYCRDLWGEGHGTVPGIDKGNYGAGTAATGPA